jgi:DnaJ-class molecular chaperone
MAQALKRRRLARCPDCNGSGHHLWSKKRCKPCKGTGQVSISEKEDYERMRAFIKSRTDRYGDEP